MPRQRFHGYMLWAVAALGLSPQLLFGGAVCGPGNHWVDTCPGGLYTFSSVSTVAVNLDLDGNGSLETNIPFLQLFGGTSVFLGTGSATTHSIGTELASLLETDATFGITLKAGDGNGNLANDGPLFSPGAINEQAGNPALADSFFDVFFEIDIPLPAGPLILTNQTGLIVDCVGLSSAPPSA